MQKTNILVLILGLGIAIQAVSVQGQVFDQLFTANAREKVQEEPESGSRVRNIFRDMFSSNVPGFFDMVKNGTSMGINVLQGLVKVERGEEAERSGLQGRRPLSVRVFGVPVYERGQRVRAPDSQTRKPGFFNSEPESGPEPKGREEEELPIYR